MPEGIVFMDQSIMYQMGLWRDSGEKAGVLLVDENGVEERNNPFCSTQQYIENEAEVIRLANSCLFPIFITRMTVSENVGTLTLSEDEDNGLPEVLSSKLDGSIKVYKKSNYDPRCTSNRQLVPDVCAEEIQHLIVMGQSRNACCACTANNLASNISGLDIYTSPHIVRFGSVADCTDKGKWEHDFLSIEECDFAGWPYGRTTVCSRL